jgi:GNAT superfamily N-acetyltransferase
MSEIKIVRLEALPVGGLTELVAESEAAGFRFVRRLVTDWDTGHNRFDGLGEALFAALAGPRIVGVCGLNADPYAAAPGVGRVRRLYVLEAFRRSGVGRRLVRTVIDAVQGRFRLLRLRTDSGAAARFYEALGFWPCVGVSECTHTLDLVG